jgi:hypothetical protein
LFTGITFAHIISRFSAGKAVSSYAAQGAFFRKNRAQGAVAQGKERAGGILAPGNVGGAVALAVEAEASNGPCGLAPVGGRP